MCWINVDEEAVSANLMTGTLLSHEYMLIWYGTQANVDASVPPEQWTLDVLANKMKQYCYLLEDLTEDMLRQKAGNDFEALRGFLRQRAVDAYWQKVQQVDSLEQGLMQVSFHISPPPPSPLPHLQWTRNENEFCEHLARPGMINAGLMVAGSEHGYQSQARTHPPAGRLAYPWPSVLSADYMS